jgi:hypothetical protein
VFGAVGTLQNVASIISMQITPVVVPVEVPVVVPVTTCAATGDVAKSSAVINASFFMCASRSSVVHHQFNLKPLFRLLFQSLFLKASE